MTGQAAPLNTEPAAPRRANTRELLFAWFHLAVLWAFAVAKPLFDVLADEPEFFVARGNTSVDIVVFGLAATFLPPTLMVLCEAALIPFRAARRVLHLVFIGALVAAIALQVLAELAGGPGGLLVLAALAVGAAGSAAYARTRLAPGVLSVLAPAPFVVAGLFLFVSPVSDLVLPQADEAAAAEGQVRGSTPVVMLVFDELSGASLRDRRGSIDASRFPHLARLARDATWYPNATTVADETAQAVPAILSGLRPAEGRLPIASDYPLSLFTALGERYDMNVEEPATDLCPQRLCGSRSTGSAPDRVRALVDDLSVVSARLLLPEDLEDRLPPVDRTFAGFRRAGRDEPAAANGLGGVPTEGLENRPARFDRFLAGVRAGDRPGLHFLHLALPHNPWEYLPSGQAYAVNGPDIPGLTGDEWSKKPWFSAQAEQRYLLQLGYADRLVGRLVRRLREEGLYERSLMIVTADHGISFRPGRGRRAATGGAIEGIANVPLIVKKPGQRSGRTDEAPALTVDILPTVADTLSAPLGRRVDGRPLPRSESLGRPLEVHAFGGGEARIPFAEFVRRRDAETARRMALFGAGDGFAGVFGAGPRPELVGRAVAGAPSAGPADFRVEFDFRPEYSSFVPDAAGVPAFVTGRLSGAAKGDETVAIAINGRIAAVTHSYLDGSELRVGALVAPAAFRAGANRVEAFAVEGSGSRVRLAGAGRAADEGARLVRRDGDLAVVLPGGRAIAVEPGVADGFVDSVSAEGGRLSVAGWATEGGHKGPVDNLLLFAGDRLLQATPPGGQRPDLTELFGAQVQPAGYEFSGIGSSEGLSGKDLRVFAVVGERASEIRAGSPQTVP